MGNGFDINNFGSMISNLGKATAGLQKDEFTIDTKSELNTYVSGWDAIKETAEKQGATSADIASLEGDMKAELAGLLGAEFGEKAQVAKNEKAAFSAEEVSLESMMALLEEEDGLSLDKVREYNKVPLATLDEAIDGVYEMTEAGFSNELIQVLLDEAPGAVKYITNSIKDGSASRITSSAQVRDEYAEKPWQMDILGYIQEDSFNKKFLG